MSSPTSQPTVTDARERPLGPAARVLLVLSSIALLLLFYVAVAVVLVYLVTFILLAVAIALTIGLRLGFAGWMLQRVMAQGALAFLIARGMFLGRPIEYHLELKPEDGPALYTLIADVARELSAPVPDEVLLDADLNAAVALRGYFAGRGRCRLHLGFDLLVALPPEEVRAVIAHELAHARLIQRGFLGWLFAGLNRMSVLAEVLQSMTDSAEEQDSRFQTARTLAFCARAGAVAGTRMAATYLRQDEFEADAVAAELCGSGVYARSLVRLHVASQAPPLSWRDRVIQSQRDGSYCAWLRGHLKTDLAPDPALLLSVITDATADVMRTHPSLSDRLAALPNPGAVFPQSFNVSAAEALISDPDETLRRLIDRLEETAAGEQRKENRTLVAEIRKLRADARRLRQRKGGGWLLGLGLAILAVVALPVVDVETRQIWATAATVLAIIGAVILVLTRVRDQGPVPHFSLLALDAALRRRPSLQPEYRRLPEDSEPIWPSPPGLKWFWGGLAVFGVLWLFATGIWATPNLFFDLVRLLFVIGSAMAVVGGVGLYLELRRRNRAWRPEADEPGELRRIGTELRRLGDAELWRQQAEAAFAGCDFLRALAASRLRLGEVPGDRHARIIHAICCGYFEDEEAALRLLQPMLAREGLSPSLNCAMAWIAAFAGRWVEGEGYLLEAIEHRKTDATLWRWLAYMEWKRGKALESARSARRSVELAAGDRDAADDSRALLARILVGLGRPRHACEELDRLTASAATERPVRVAGLRAALLLGRTEEAEARVLEMEAAEGGRGLLEEVELAHCFLEAERIEDVEPRLARVVATGFFPLAHVMLAHLAGLREDRAVVFTEIHTALDLDRPVIPGAGGPLDVLDEAFEVLRTLEPPTADCGAWIFRLDLGKTANLPYLQVTVCDVDYDRAFGRVRWLCGVLTPGRDPLSVALALTPSQKPIKPAGLMSPGFYDAVAHR